MEYIVKTDNLCKRYGRKMAVDNVNMNVREGDIYGLIGRNGAGKTTAMKMIIGMNFPTSGSIEIFGSSDLNAGRKSIGSIIEEPGFYKDKTAYANLKLFGLLTETSDEEIRELLEFVGLGNTGKKKVKEFSLGMRQRLGIALTLMGNPKLLVLDEPMNGLDPAGIKEIRDLIIKINREKKTTIIISSHLLDELAKIATCYGIINDGKLIEEIDAEELERRIQGFITLKVDNIELAVQNLQGVVNPAHIAPKPDRIEIHDADIDTSVIIETLVKSGVRVYELSRSQNGFENYFIEKIG